MIHFQVPKAFSRNIDTLSEEEQARLSHSKVCIVGLGGLGGTVAEILVRTGIGNLILVDRDRFDPSNMNRQLVCTEETIGNLKVDETSRRLKTINPDLNLNPHIDFLTADNASEILGEADVVVDCLDSLEARFDLEQAARNGDKPLVSAAVSGISGYVTTILPGDSGLQEILNQLGEETSDSEPVSCLAAIVFLIASLETNEVIKLLLDRNGLLRNRLLLVDLSDNIFEEFPLTDLSDG